MDYQKIILRRNDFRGRVQTLFQGIDLLVIPTTGVASPTTAQMATLGENPDLISALLRFHLSVRHGGQPHHDLAGGIHRAKDTDRISVRFATLRGRSPGARGMGLSTGDGLASPAPCALSIAADVTTTAENEGKGIDTEIQ